MPLCTEESWYQWEDSLLVAICSIRFNTYAFPSCSSLFPHMMPYISLYFQFLIFWWGWMLSKQWGMGNGVVMKAACNETNRGLVTQWRADSLWLALQIWKMSIFTAVVLIWRTQDGGRTGLRCGKHRSFTTAASYLGLQLLIEISEYPAIILYILRKQKRLL